MLEADDAVPPDSDELGRSYELLMEQNWEVDAGVLAMPGSEAAPAGADGNDVPPSPERIVEAMLFVGGPPLTATRACDTVRGLTEAQFLQAIDGLNQDYRKQGRPYGIMPQGAGFVLHLRPRFRSISEKVFGSVRQARLSTAAIDVLALVAYRQPATKQEVDSIRGAESGALLRQLVRRGLIAVVQRGDSAQREVSYGTTPRFLELFGLASLDDLPQTQDLQKL